MSFKEIIGHEAQIASLRRAFTDGRVAHAYLFTGPEGVGKKKTALAFVKLLVCERPEGADPCGQCASCRRVEGRLHPDVQWVDPDGSCVKIDAVREACRRLNLKSFEEGRKALVIPEARFLNEESSNALLKTLEEPAPDTVLILLTDSFPSMLATIASRCQRLVFSPLGEEVIASVLRGRHGMAQDESVYLSRFCGGSLGAAVRCHENGLFERKNRIIADAMNRRLSLDDFMKLFEGEKADRDARYDEALDVLSSWFRDLFLAGTVAGYEDFVNADRRQEIARLCRLRQPLDLERRIACIAEARTQRERNLNLKILLAQLRSELWM